MDVISTETTSFMNESTTNAFVYTPPFDHLGIVVNCVILIPLAAFGIFGNVLTILVITKTPKLFNSVFNRFILSLCFSDLTSAVISPLFLYRRTYGFTVWEWPDILCKFAFGLDNWTSFVTSAHILLFTSLRFTSVYWPIKFKAFKLRHTKVTCVLIWFISFAIGFIPFVLFTGSEVRDRSLPTVQSKWPSCTIQGDWINSFKMYIYVAHSIMFYIPIPLIAVLSMMIAYKIRTMRKKRNQGRRSDTTLAGEIRRTRKERFILLQLSLIVGSFLLGYIPLTVYYTYTTNYKATTDKDAAFDWLFGCTAYIALRFSETLNPVFYNVASTTMRNQSKECLQSCTCNICSSCKEPQGIRPKSSSEPTSTRNETTKMVSSKAAII